MPKPKFREGDFIAIVGSPGTIYEVTEVDTNCLHARCNLRRSATGSWRVGDGNILINPARVQNILDDNETLTPLEKMNFKLTDKLPEPNDDTDQLEAT